MRGRVSAGLDNMGGTSANRLTGLSGGVDGDIIGNSGGAQSHVVTLTEAPPHLHADNIAVAVAVTVTLANATGVQRGTGVQTVTNLGVDYYVYGTTVNGAIDDKSNITATATATETVTGGVLTAGGGAAHNNVQPTFVKPKIIKL